MPVTLKAAISAYTPTPASKVRGLALEVPVLPVDGTHFQAFVDVAVSPQFLGWVAGLGGGLRIVSPEPVVQKMQALVQRLAEQYCAPDGDKTSV